MSNISVNLYDYYNNYAFFHNLALPGVGDHGIQLHVARQHI